MSKAPKRTRPLDRDGDGRDGGSLPGNQTAPMADSAEQTDETETPTEWVRDDALIVLKLDAAGVRDHDEDALISVEQVTQWPDEDARAAEAFADSMLAEGSHTVRGEERRADGTLIELPAILAERHVLPRETKPTETSSDAPSSSDDTPEVAEADPAANAASGNRSGPSSWTRDDAAILAKLGKDWIETDPGKPGALTLETLASWSDEEARAADVFAVEMNDPGRYTDAEGDWRRDDGSVIEPPECLDPYLFGLGRGQGDDTFTAEEIAAGQTDVVQAEGEEMTTAADQAATIDPADPLATIQTGTAPIAVRLSQLAQLTGSKRLYRTASGYSATHSAPYIETATVDGWIAAGLAEWIPSAGNTGGVKATDEARRVERHLRRELAEAA
ncbi:MAG: hypothetical protein ACT6TH_14450 [Brevundimonas sp.]|uniref:hypothetical protein n=1 Tax=Brevundimonas sp. TaxID=1871086 RepID=UPI004034C7B3